MTESVSIHCAWRAALCGALLMAASSSWAADDDGNYAIRGPGAASCGDFREQVQEDGDTARLFASWQEGYLTATNRHLEDTFDISPVMASATVLNMLNNVCRDNPDIRVETALARLAGLFHSARVETASSPVTITAGDASISIRQSVLERVQDALRDRGYDDIEATGRFDDSTRDALRDFQENEGIRSSGVPDADSLVRLVFDSQE